MTIPGINRSSITQRTNMTKMKLMNLNCIRLVKNKDFRGQLGGCCFHIPKPRFACAFVLKNRLRFSKLLPLRFAALMDFGLWPPQKSEEPQARERCGGSSGESRRPRFFGIDVFLASLRCMCCFFEDLSPGELIVCIG